MGRFILKSQNQSIYECIQSVTADFMMEEDCLLELQGSDQGLHVIYQKGRAVIRYHRLAGLFRGLGFIKQWIQEDREAMDYQEAPVFAHLTYMADCSRNAVMNVAQIKRMIHWMALMGYDRLMLYTEDTFELEDYPFFGYFRGRYTKEELTAIDAYAGKFGIELVPCIQTLAHLNAIFRWHDFRDVHDNGDILCCGLEKTYELIEAMIKTYAECCQSRVINIGMDEAEMIGRGNYLTHFGYEKRFDIMEKHVKRVREICQKYGYRCMMWSDMYFKMLTGGYYQQRDFQVSEEAKARIPQDVELIYWDYYSRDADRYQEMLSQHKQMSEQIAFAGGAWKWSGFAPLLNHSMLASGLGLTACKNNHIQNVIVTGWGDRGAEASQIVVLPILALFAEYCYAQNRESRWIEKRLEAIAGAKLKDFLKLDCLNLTPDNPSPGKLGLTPVRYLLYQDPLLGLYDVHIDQTAYREHYQACYRELSVLRDGGGAFAYVFESLAKLARVLVEKSDLGIRIKQAYDNHNSEELNAIIPKCSELIHLIEDFQQSFRKQWSYENKIFGLEVQDIRLGALKERIRIAAERIRSYLEGEIDEIEELKAERRLIRQQFSNDEAPSLVDEDDWHKIVTTAVL